MCITGWGEIGWSPCALYPNKNAALCDMRNIWNICCGVVFDLRHSKRYLWNDPSIPSWTVSFGKLQILRNRTLWSMSYNQELECLNKLHKIKFKSVLQAEFQTNQTSGAICLQIAWDIFVWYQHRHHCSSLLWLTASSMMSGKNFQSPKSLPLRSNGIWFHLCIFCCKSVKQVESSRGDSIHRRSVLMAGKMIPKRVGSKGHLCVRVNMNP